MASSSLDDESSSSTTFVSRRRLAFRPPANPHPKGLTSAESQAAMTLANLDGNDGNENRASTSNDNYLRDEAARRKAAKSWTHEDIMAYYEALKIHGKDFESVAKMLLKRKILKDKDQVKNYFYNSLKILKQLLAIDEDDMGDIPKDAKELFLALNACEWKKRTSNGKFVSEKLKELLFEGATNIRLNKKTLQIKTPPCPSLIRWFNKFRKIDKMPTEITFILKPKSNGDANYLRSNLKNPLLKVKMNTNDKLSKLIDLLQMKWNINRDEEEAEQEKEKEKNDLKVKIWPSYVTDVGSLSIVETDISPFVALSLNKLRKEYDDFGSVKKNVPSTTESIISASEATNTKSSYTVLYPKPFTLTDDKLKEGLCEDNIENIIVAELYCTCGMTDFIELRYGIELSNTEEARNEPWKIMLGMLSRDYGESLCGTKKDDNEITSTLRKREKETNEDSSHSAEYELPAKRTNSRSSINRKVANNSNMKIEKTNGNQTSFLTSVIQNVADEEFGEFENQLAQLKKNRVSKKAKAGTASNRIVNSRRMATPIIQYQPERIVEQRQIPMCQMIPKRQPVLNEGIRNKEMYSPTKQPQNNQMIIRQSQRKIVQESPKTDFSDLVITPVKRDESDDVQKQRNDSFLNSLNTPTKTPKKSTMEVLFGGEISMSPGITRKSAMNMTNHDDEGSRCELTDILFGEISSTPTKYTSHHESNGGDGLGFSDSEVQQSYVDMITSSQDSRDFVMQHFKTKTKSPQKKRN